MTRGIVLVEGETYLHLEVVAEVYEVSAVWLRTVVEFGLLDRYFEAEGALCIAAVELDRVATIVRLRHVVGADLDAISIQLG